MFKNYILKDLKFDFKAGLAVAALSLPIGVAYAEMLGLPPESGIYTAVFALLGYFILGTSKELIIGPDSAIIAIIASSIIAFGISETELKIQFTILTTIITGLLFFICGFLRLGFIANFLSRPILMGYLNGVAVILIISQLQKFTGVEIKNSSSIAGLFEFIKGIESIHIPTAIIGIISLFLISFFRVYSKKIPAPILLILISIIFGSLLGLEKLGIKFSPEIQSSFPMPVLPELGLFRDYLPKILADASAILFISYTNTMLISRSLSKNKFAIDPDREFYAMGLSDFLSGLFKGFPASGSSIRTKINIETGARTKFSLITAALSMLAVVIFFPKQFSLIPSVIFAAIIIDSAMGMFDFKEIKEIRLFSNEEFRISIICMLGVMVIGVLDGILLALVMSFYYLIKRSSAPLEYELVFDPKSETISGVEEHNQNLVREDFFIYRFNSPMLFYNFDYFRKKLFDRISERQNLKFIIIDCNPVVYIDITFRDNLTDIVKEMNRKNIKVIFCFVNDSFQNKMTKKLTDENLDTEIFYKNISSGIKTIISPG
ncbi:MAG TPA: SulP family inorganic anion transporter [Ignavibacteria bacterium]|nr:SulP family inorganic anion transporter [Ignavibacteria bacterium]